MYLPTCSLCVYIHPSMYPCDKSLLFTAPHIISVVMNRYETNYIFLSLVNTQPKKSPGFLNCTSILWIQPSGAFTSNNSLMEISWLMVVPFLPLFWFSMQISELLDVRREVRGDEWDIIAPFSQRLVYNHHRVWFHFWPYWYSCVYPPTQKNKNSVVTRYSTVGFCTLKWYPRARTCMIVTGFYRFVLSCWSFYWQYLRIL